MRPTRGTLYNSRIARLATLRLGTIPALVVLAAACGRYPAPPDTARGDVVDTLHGIAIADPYRWLEDQDSPDTREWIDRQNAYAETIVGQSNQRTETETRLRALMDVDNVGSPTRRGDYEFFTMRRSGQDLSVIYRRPAPDEDAPPAPIDPDGDYEVIIDPHEMAPEPTTSVSIQTVSPDGNLLIYAVRDGGQDEVEIRIRDVEAGVDLPDRLPNSLYSSISFNEEGTGFYYSRRSRQLGARIRFHNLGADMENDEELFGAGYGPDKFVSVSQANEGRHLIYTVQHGWTRNEVHIQDLRSGGPPRQIAGGQNAMFNPRFMDGELYMRTNLDAPNYRVVRVDLSNPAPELWRNIIAESEDVLQSWTQIDGKLYATYLHNVSTKINIFEMDGTPAGEIEVPEHHTASIRGADDGAALLTLSSLTSPSVIYRVDLETRQREVWKEADIEFDASDIEVEQVWYESKDGTRAPMYVMHRRDIQLTGDHPTLLYGYGGFNVSLTPRFDATAAVWVENGGVYAVATLRGGSEFGEEWHRAGMLENKQNVFDDFISAAEHLVEMGYTNSNKLAIRGTSNGGLLVGSALTQRPDLFRAVLCGFPDLDMVRFYQFTETNNLPALHEYGDASIPEQFEFLRQYSPYQNVVRGTNYPAVMFNSGDLDTRVPPLQARKMAARLQDATISGLPVILLYHPKAGHAGGRGVGLSKRIEQQAMELAFLFEQLGVGS